MKRAQKHKSITREMLPPIPEKRFFSISEAEHLCGLKAYVLRYWEQEFSQLRPLKRRGNRRYYQKKDILLVRQIRKLLYEDAFTIAGARSQLSTKSTDAQLSLDLGPVSENESKNSLSNENSERFIKKMIAELENLLQNLRSDCDANVQGNERTQTAGFLPNSL